MPFQKRSFNRLFFKNVAFISDWPWTELWNISLQFKQNSVWLFKYSFPHVFNTCGDTDQGGRTAANSDEAWLDQASLALASGNWGPGAQHQRRGPWTSRGGQLLLLLLLAESLDLLWRHRDGLTRTMRGVRRRGTREWRTRRGHPKHQSKGHTHTERCKERS